MKQILKTKKECVEKKKVLLSLYWHTLVHFSSLFLEHKRAEMVTLGEFTVKKSGQKRIERENCKTSWEWEPVAPASFLLKLNDAAAMKRFQNLLP